MSMDVWHSPYGLIPVPVEISRGIRFTRKGYPYKDNPKKYWAFMQWVGAQEAQLIRNYSKEWASPPL